MGSIFILLGVIFCIGELADIFHVKNLEVWLFLWLFLAIGVGGWWGWTFTRKAQ
jgi:hypothetical protein